MAEVLWFMHALGRQGLPRTVEVAGHTWRLRQTVKHDFFAATGFYTDDSGTKSVVKINRRHSVLGLRLIGRSLARREIRAYRALADLPNIPPLLGEVTDTGLMHAYAEGQPLGSGPAVPDQFFDELMQLMHELHRRGIAYVDTNKPQNILIGDDGRPYLIDFQISWDLRSLWPRWLSRRVLGMFHRGDVYHVLKHKRRFRPDLLSNADRARLDQRGLLHTMHRVVTRPYFWVRRPVLAWLRRTGRVADAGSD